MTRSDVLATVKKHIMDVAEELTEDNIDPTMSMKELGINSLDIVEVVSCSMRELKIKVPRSELSKLTYKWGTADEDVVRERFAHINAPAPDIVRADAGNAEDTRNLMQHLRSATNGVGVFISNVSAALIVAELKNYSLKALFRSIEYSAWPMCSCTRHLAVIRVTWPEYPRPVWMCIPAAMISWLRVKQ